MSKRQRSQDRSAMTKDRILGDQRIFDQAKSNFKQVTIAFILDETVDWPATKRVSMMKLPNQGARPVCIGIPHQSQKGNGVEQGRKD